MSETKEKQIKMKESLGSILESTRDEYKYLLDAKNSLHTRTGILIALLTALVSASFIKEPLGFIELFKNNVFLAHFKIIVTAALLVAFLISLIFYVKVFFTRDYLLFNYKQFTSGSVDSIRELDDDAIIVTMYKDYEKCIEYNQKQFSKMVELYKKGNVWLIVTIICTIGSIIISLV